MSRFGNRTAARNHREAAELLPWYVNGTLEGAELERLTLHLDSCDLCRAELAQQRRLAQVLRTSEELAFSTERAFERLSERLDREEELETSARDGLEEGLWRRLLAVFRGLASPVRWALVAQMVVILGLAVTLVRDRSVESEFRTLSQPASAGRSEAARLRVVFDEGAPEGDVRTLLVESGARIVDGPSPFGVYTLEIDASTGVDVLDVLRSSGLVAFAEPVAGGADARP